ncbi:GNAT family N-acetyltransferase [Aliikangiella sp. G2MR2-5]|uniref:GNAT family N-acetyltransferase n=1 Tax=Aliikangiella sp. G2MR2-5 TaxID=2788943 RepID=UPI0018AA367F|nr:GNAT family N-acetyltransferase [Aliikangiella sp. G2MR2-5]
MTIDCRPVDYANSVDANNLVELLDDYAKDPMGGGSPLKPDVKEKLVRAMAERNDVFSFIAYEQDEPVGLVNCVEGFSTFKAKPLMNIHDLTVKRSHRGKGIARLLMQAAEDLAKSRHCCKLTLEVLEGNEVAKQAYVNFGFKGYELDPEMGKATFWEKPLT